ncbi:EAL domain-containing protein [Sphingomonas sanguinis]|uniref:bifunctional diguanylate cyclase/phosphodiesterase n=1 Tax=Sphingomonas sanguinis TaxID=33051 RepID=UPI001C575B8E|nr:EAL domain-containing protein [Sphingomonas sanguinis]QXT36331.1 EAL domain-containing protein [Sphingomonas sanguinis]
MLNIVGCIIGQHDPWLILPAFGVCVLGLVALFLLHNRSEECVEIRRRNWVALAAITGGVSIWCTHFLAMLAYHGPLPLGFDLPLTLVSIAAPCLTIWAALAYIRRRKDLSGSLVVGSLITVGVGTMHLLGMAALIVPAQIHYELVDLIAALIGAMLFLSAAFYIHAELRGPSRLILSVVAAALGIGVLHFGAMTATTLIPGGVVVDPGLQTIQPRILARLVGFVTATMVAAVVAAALVDRLLTDLRGLTQATREGIAILHHGRIVEANARLATMLNVEASRLPRSRPNDWLEAIDGTDLTSMAEGVSVETRPRGAGSSDRCLEVAAHEIEYRGRRATVMAVRDLTEQRRAQRQIEFMAVHDSLTELPNRAYFTQALESAIAQADQKGPFALLALDLDRFKAVNDLFGHAAGDAILCRVAAILTKVIDEAGVVARVGGDEFLILQRGLEDPECVRRLTETILESFAAEMDLSRDPMAVGVSIGVSLFPQDATDAQTLRQNADVALYRAKTSGRGTASFFDQDMDRTMRKRLALEHDLRHALLRNQMRLVYQPLVSTDSAEIIGHEALLRWEHPERGSVEPLEFVPLAEETGIILQLGEWVLATACRTAASWPAPMTLAVNVSPIQFQLPNLAEIVARALNDSGFPAHRLELEITENVLLHDRASTLKTLHQLKAMGVGIVMDDFGTGYSSLSNLRCFPFDKIKIDKSFISGVTTDAAARSIIRAIVGLGQSLNLPVVAEGVETAEQHRMVLEEGCPQAQGYLFGRPAQPLVGAQPLARALR